jgi:tetratricopeptide (TPR) repeat protein
VGIFDAFRRSEVAKARREAERTPNPGTIEALCRTLAAEGRLDEALQQAEAGLQKFPEAEPLTRIIKHIKKDQLGPQVAELKEKLRTSPSPVLYRQLAEHYRDIGDDQKALDTCMEVRERYPKDENTFLVAGEIFFDRFQSAFLASDGKQAIENLRNACSLNRNNYSALLKLAQVYINVGMFAKAIPCLRTITNFAPADRVVKHLLARSVEFSSTGVDEDDDDDYVLRHVEEQKAPLYRVVYDATGGADIKAAKGRRPPRLATDIVVRELEGFELGSVFRGIVAFDGELDCTFQRFFGSHGRDDAALQAAAEIVGTLVKQAPRLAMGSLRDAQLEKAGLGLRVFHYADFYFFLLLSPEARAELVDQQITDLIGRLGR